ncbi:hypothetical protein KNE206_53200 [Kitasatospora sp. NE20-6]
MPTALAPTDLVLTSPLHLAGPGSEDFTRNLSAHFGWDRPATDDGDVVLVSPCERATLSRSPATGRWEAAVPSTHAPALAWAIAFDDSTPREITAGVLYTLAHGLEHWPRLLVHHFPGRDAALGVLSSSGWAFQQRDGHQVLLAPDRLAALTRPLTDEGAFTVLTGAAERGTWNVTFSPRTPAVLLHSGAAALLRPALRTVAEVPAAHRGQMSLKPPERLLGGDVRLSPRYLAGPGISSVPSALPPPLWTSPRPGVVGSSCGRARVETGIRSVTRIAAGPEGPDHRLSWAAEFSAATPPEIVEDWLTHLSRSVAADIDQGTTRTFDPGTQTTCGEAIRPLQEAGWKLHTDDADLYLVSPDGHATAHLCHGLLARGVSSTEALAATAHWGMSVDVTGSPATRWHAHLTSLTPLHLAQALSETVAAPTPAVRTSDRVPARLRPALHTEPVITGLSPAARSARNRSPVTVSPAAPAAGPTAVPAPRPARRP